MEATRIRIMNRIYTQITKLNVNFYTETNNKNFTVCLFNQTSKKKSIIE